MAKTLTINAAALGDVLALLERAGSPRADTTLGAATIAELCAGAYAFEVCAEGARVGAYALRTVDHSAARVAWVQAAGGHLPGVDLTAEVIPAIEVQAAQLLDADQVAITTRRRALIVKLMAQGYEITGITLRKNL